MVAISPSQTPSQAATPAIPVSIRDSGLKLRDILRTLPPDCFERNPRKAWASVLFSIASAILGYWAIAVSPWFLLPLAWAFTGTALTGFFVIGHDCGHRSFAKRKWVNDLVGHTMMLPLIYPFHSWRILHNYHHKHTNKLEIDNAWQPFQTDFYENLNPVSRIGYQGIRGYFWWLGSILHWAFLHFDWREFSGQDRQRVKFSSLLVIGFAAIFFPTLLFTTGVWGLIKFWLMPWLVYHFWMSTFTLVHHTDVEVPFRPTPVWNELEAQLTGTIHCDYPRWVEFLCHDINVHIPHHISTAIPSYNLRRVHHLLLQQWGDHMKCTRFSWNLMQGIADQCHLYEPMRNYQSFQEFRHATK